jgi:hypothetical protein
MPRRGKLPNMSKDVYIMASECHLRPALKAVLQQLAWFADPNGRNTYPSVETISGRTGLERRTVQKMLRELEAPRIICAVGSQRGGRGHSTRYEINMGKLRELKETANCMNSSGRHKREPESQRATATPKKSEQHSPEQQEHEKQQKANPVLGYQNGKAQKRTEQPRTVNRIPDGLDQDRGEQAWSAILERLEARVDTHSFDIWLKPLKAAGCADGVLWIQVPTPAFKEMAERYTDHINAALAAEEICDIREVRFTC